jgi:predicted phosphodiesterase
MVFQHSYRHVLKGRAEELKIKPIFDVHLGSPLCDLNALREYLSESDKDTVFICGGDLLDCIIVSDTKRYRKGGDNNEGEAIIDDQIDKMVKILSPYKDRILGIGNGNHEDNITIRCGTNPSARIAKAINVPELGYSWLYRIFLDRKVGKNTDTRMITIRGHHGWSGGSRTQGADLTKYSRDVAYWDADLFLYGHTHRLQSDEIPRLGLNKAGKLIARPKAMVICGTYLKTFSQDTTPSYSEKAGYPPLTIGGASISLRKTNEWVKIRVTL